MTAYDWSDIDAAATAAAGAAGWEVPVPLSGPAPCPPLPTDGFPVWLRDMIAAVAHFTQTDPTMSTTVALSALSACVSGRLDIEPKPGWTESLSLYTAVVAAPGERKTAVHNAFTKPITTAQKLLAAKVAPVTTEKSARRDIADRAAEKAKAMAAKADGAERDQLIAEAVSAAMAAEAITVPGEPRLITDDASPEKLTGLMADNAGRMAILSDEGGIVDTVTGRFSSAPNLDPYLKGHVGSPLQVDRVGRASEHVERPALTVGVMIQPQVLRNLGKNPEAVGKGLVARFLFTMPASYAGWCDPEADPVPDDVANAYNTNITDLALHHANHDETHTLTLSPEAQAARVEWARAVEVRRRPGGDLREIPEWGAKLVGTTMRLAGLLHVAHHLTDATSHAIDADTMRHAVDLADTLAVHYRAAIHTAATDPEDGTVARVLDVLIDKHMTVFTRREVQRRVQRHLPKAAAVLGVLDTLTSLGWIRPTTDGRGYELHPNATDHRESGDTVTIALEAAFSAAQRAHSTVTTPDDTPVTPVTGAVR